MVMACVNLFKVLEHGESHQVVELIIRNQNSNLAPALHWQYSDSILCLCFAGPYGFYC